MSQATQEDVRLRWDLADRLHKALRISGVSNAEMAAALGVHRNTVSNYLRGKKVDRRTLVTWSITCGVPLQWLQTGEIPEDPGTGFTREYVLHQGAQVISFHRTPAAPEATTQKTAA
jgi:transcriptional regulator with XRE-family HTH domain